MKRIFFLFLIIGVLFLATGVANAITTDANGGAPQPPKNTDGGKFQGDSYSGEVPQYGSPIYLSVPGPQGSQGPRGKRGRHGMPSYLDLRTGYIVKMSPANGAEKTDKSGNVPTIVGKVSQKELLELRDSVGSYSILKPNGELLIYNMRGELRRSFNNADTSKLAEEIWAPVRENTTRSKANTRVNKAQDGQIRDLQDTKADRTQLGWAGWWYWVILGAIILLALVFLGLRDISFSFGAGQRQETPSANPVYSNNAGTSRNPGGTIQIARLS